MEPLFYGTKINQPTQIIAEAFGSYVEPVLLEGGQGTSYRAGNIVLKPSIGVEQSNWMAEVFDDLPESEGVRFPKPIKSVQGTWIREGYVAWSFLKGEHVKGQYDQKLPASLIFHDLLKNISKPHFLEVPQSSWSAADKAVWGEGGLVYDEGFSDLLNQIKPELKPLNLKFQLIHGDLSGNFILHPELAPAIIDFSPAWAPSGFAEGIMLADAITWENAPPQALEAFRKVPYIEQLAWRGVLRRIVEQAEHMKWFGKPEQQAVKEAMVFQKAIVFLNKWFT